MQLTLTLPEMLVKKMRALAALDESVEDFEGLILDTVDSIVTGRIADAIGISVGDSSVPTYTRLGVDPRMPVSMSSITVAPATMGMAVADGLSSEDVSDFDDEDEDDSIDIHDDSARPPVQSVPSPKPTKQATKQPVKPSVSVEQILKDNAVSDPETEAVSGDNEEVAFDELFASSLVQEPVRQPEIELPAGRTPRPYARKMPKTKAKVAEFTNIYESDGF